MGTVMKVNRKGVQIPKAQLQPPPVVVNWKTQQRPSGCSSTLGQKQDGYLTNAFLFCAL
jgi:hypothetical protein